MIDSVRAWVEERLAEEVRRRGGIVGAVVIGASKAASGKVTFLFLGKDARPVVVAKVARTPAGEAALLAEHDALRTVRSTGAEVVLTSAPEPLALERIQTRLALVTSALPGVPMLTRYYTPGHTADPGRVGADLRAAGSWLLRFHSETRCGETELGEEGLEAWVHPVIRRYRAEIGWSDAEGALFGAVLARARALRDTPLPLSAVHGDYWMGNLLMTGDDIGGVLDWERGQGRALPFRDVYKFPTSYGFYLDRAYPGRGRVPGHRSREEEAARWRRFGTWTNLPGFGYAYFGRGWFPEQVRRFVVDHLEALGVPAAANAVFFPLFLAEQAMTLDVRAFREGYRSLLIAFWEERASTWLWSESPAEATSSR